MSKSKGIMIDLETLDTTRTSTIIQIGMVVYDSNYNEVDDYCLFPSYNDQLANGGTKSKSTIEFWTSDRNKKVFKAILKTCDTENLPIHHAIKEVKDYISYHNVSEITANGILFDIGILDYWFNYTFEQTMQEVFGYGNFRDFKTIRNEYRDVTGVNLFKTMKFQGDMHNAVDDCRYQLKMLKHIREWQKGGL